VTAWLRIEAGSFANAVQKIDLSTNPSPTITNLGVGPGWRGQYWLEVEPMGTWYESKNVNGYRTGQRFSVDEPALTVMANGLGGDHERSWRVMQDNSPQLAAPASNKPAYHVPSMQEIGAMPWNGLKVASTFAGAGGSSTGYRMVGCRVVWANEFVPAAQDSYRANMHEATVLDCRDIRDVEPDEILEACGLQPGELDIFDGSPPCQAFSTAGKRQRGWGQEKTYEHGAKQRNEDLFLEYIRLLRELRPKVFVAENVSGLAKGVAKGYFLEILAELKACGYRVEARMLDAQWLGVPQQRNRLIFVGVRNDLGLAPAFPKPLPYRYSVRDACPWIVETSNEQTGRFRNAALLPDNPAPTVPSSGGQSYKRHAVISEAGHGFMPGVHADVEQRPAPTIRSGKVAVLVVGDRKIARQPGSNFPRSEPRSLDQPCLVIHAQAGAIGGAACHHLETSDTRNEMNVSDGIERRRFTIPEVKRICAFPDDYVLTGSYSQQWERLGNSVPPLMMRAIAETIRDEIFGRLQCRQ
jgi:DNA (cytosine-5)-methyltransferase 1